VNCPILNMDFPDESFDIIWAEGSTFIIGFERALREWRRLINKFSSKFKEFSENLLTNIVYEFTI